MHQINTYNTERLKFIAATFEHLDIGLYTPKLLPSLLNAEISPEWPPGEYNKNALEYFRNQLSTSSEELVGWLSWYVIKSQKKGNQQS